MVSLTENEAKAMEFLIRNFFRHYNINQLAKEIHISPGGMFKILKKLKARSFLTEDKLGNNIFYEINYKSYDALDACKFVLTEKKTTPYIRVWAKDFEPLIDKVNLAIIFGSILKKGKDAGDVDVLLVFDRENLKAVDALIDGINKVKSKKIHAVYQTKNDLIENIKKRDKAVLEEIQTGVILWGRDVLMEAIASGQG